MREARRPLPEVAKRIAGEHSTAPSPDTGATTLSPGVSAAKSVWPHNYASPAQNAAKLQAGLLPPCAHPRSPPLSRSEDPARLGRSSKCAAAERANRPFLDPPPTPSSLGEAKSEQFRNRLPRGPKPRRRWVLHADSSPRGSDVTKYRDYVPKASPTLFCECCGMIWPAWYTKCNDSTARLLGLTTQHCCHGIGLTDAPVRRTCKLE
jgi:hypothetical protein